MVEEAGHLDTQTDISMICDSPSASEKFLLRFKFDKSYPMEAPEVTFVVSDGWKAPERELSRLSYCYFGADSTIHSDPHPLDPHVYS